MFATHIYTRDRPTPFPAALFTPFTPLLPSSTTLASAITFGIEISNLEKLLFSLPDSDIQFDNNRSRILSSSTRGPKIRYRLKRVYNCWRFDTSWLSVLEERDSHGVG